MILEGRTQSPAIQIVANNLANTSRLIQQGLSDVNASRLNLRRTQASQERDTFNEFQRARDNQFRDEREQQRQVEDERNFNRNALVSDRNFGLQVARDQRAAQESAQRINLAERNFQRNLANTQSTIASREFGDRLDLAQEQSRQLRLQQQDAREEQERALASQRDDEALQLLGIGGSQGPVLPSPTAPQPEQSTPFALSAPVSEISLPTPDQTNDFFSVPAPQQESLLTLPEAPAPLTSFAPTAPPQPLSTAAPFEGLEEGEFGAARADLANRDAVIRTLSPEVRRRPEVLAEVGRVAALQEQARQEVSRRRISAETAERALQAQQTAEAERTEAQQQAIIEVNERRDKLAIEKARATAIVENTETEDEDGIVINARADLEAIAEEEKQLNQVPSPSSTDPSSQSGRALTAAEQVRAALDAGNDRILSR